jgi:hypothetical protein
LRHSHSFVTRDRDAQIPAIETPSQKAKNRHKVTPVILKDRKGIILVCCNQIHSNAAPALKAESIQKLPLGKGLVGSKFEVFGRFAQININAKPAFKAESIPELTLGATMGNGLHQSDWSAASLQ